MDRGPMDAEALKREVVRLAPWYYRWNLGPVSTEITPPCDPTGHREIAVDPSALTFLEGKTVLDLGCNEGAWSFAALDHGARSVLGIDCRSVNIEKARFLADVFGYRKARFEVGSVESRLLRQTGQHDLVFLCGLLYHLTEPSRTIAEACDLAREWVFVTCVLHGGENGYTKWKEADTIAASENAADSLMPNTVFTLLDEFEKNDFLPIAVAETREGKWWGACNLILKNCRSFARRWERKRRNSDRFMVHLVPEKDRSGSRIRVLAYNRTFEPQRLLGSLVVRDRSGHALQAYGPSHVHLVPRPSSDQDPASCAFEHVVAIDPSWGEVSMEVSFLDRDTGRPLAEHSLRVRGS